jgi:hypothetical protein
MSTLEAQLTLIAEPTPRARAQAALHDPESAATWHHQLDIETGPTGSIAVLHMAGDIDMLTLPLVCAALITALDTRPADLVVDLSQVRFCGVRGFGLLAAISPLPSPSMAGSEPFGLHRVARATSAAPDRRRRSRRRQAAADSGRAARTRPPRRRVDDPADPAASPHPARAGAAHRYQLAAVPAHPVGFRNVAHLADQRRSAINSGRA